ncbi:MAG TPA: CoA transferase [Dehalococcoidales bacterium]|jgi:crotonobetainyl-CoA:carnitine CoA-transferase CaiB-like acyl-CoA transferase
MLKDCRVLDLTNENGFLCGKMLADLGMDVIKIERPGGDPARNIGPFVSDIPDPEKSLYWFAYNSNKRGITLDLETVTGQEVFRQLVERSDIVIESFSPGYLGKLGLDYDSLNKWSKGLILTSITPFGQEGLYRDYLVSDIVTMGMSGILYQTGDLDRSPVWMNLPQACLHAGADGAVGTMMAYYHREQTGEGQHVDISMQQSTAWFLANAIPLWELNGIVSKRSGAFRWSISSSQRQVWQCRDGYVFFNIIGGRTGAKTLHELVDWMDAEARANDYVKSLDFETLDMFRVDQSTVDLISAPIEAFFLTHTKQEIAQGAAERRISICPLSSMEDLVNNAQLKSRQFWTNVEHPELHREINYPNAFIKSSTAGYGIRQRAPLVGEHNEQIYTELGFSLDHLADLKHQGVI